MNATRTESRHSSEITLLVAAAGIVAGLLTAVHAAAQQPVPFEDSLATARRHVLDGAPNRAIFHLRRHLQGHPDDLTARSLLARTLKQIGLTEAALSEASLVLAHEPNDEGARLVLAEVQIARGEHAAALKTLTVTGDCCGGPTEEALLVQARALFGLARHGEAETLLEEIAAYRDDDVAFLRLRGINALRIGTPDSLALSATVLARVTELQPDVAVNWNNLGFTLERAGRLEESYLAYVEAEGRAKDGKYASNRARVETALAGRKGVRPAATRASLEVSQASESVVSTMLR